MVKGKTDRATSKDKIKNLKIQKYIDTSHNWLWIYSVCTAIVFDFQLHDYLVKKGETVYEV